MTDRTKTPPETPAAKLGQPPSTGHVFSFIKQNTDEGGVVTIPVQAGNCPVCGHAHGGRAVGYICIGCPCDARPMEVDVSTLHHDVGAALAAACDGDHGDPPCASEQCHLKPPPIFTVTARVRRVGDHIELLCGCCDLPIDTDLSVYVEDVEDDEGELGVWHIGCARKYGESIDAAT